MRASPTDDARRPGEPPRSLEPSGQQAPALLTDLYQLTMMDVYYRTGMERTAVFEFFVRRLPETRNFLIAAGLEHALHYLETLRFTSAEIEWLAQTQKLSAQCLERLSDFRFTGDVFAMPEGSIFFASEPILRVEAPLPQAQLVESRLVNLLNYQTLIASKAVRCRLAAGDVQLIDFGMRRAHGAEAALFTARASYIGGFDATATVEAARLYGIAAAGTMAHSFVQAHAREIDAFAQFAASHPGNVVLLVDTYDTLRGAQRAADVCLALKRQGVKVQGVRIDSGDLAAEAQRVRAVLNRAGCHDIRILVSSGVDEYAIAAMRTAAAPIDAYCVGTRLSVSADAPALDCAYKLQQYADRPCRKRSQWKETWPGRRQVYRQYDRDERIAIDVLGCADGDRGLTAPASSHAGRTSHRPAGSFTGDPAALHRTARNTAAPAAQPRESCAFARQGVAAPARTRSRSRQAHGLEGAAPHAAHHASARMALDLRRDDVFWCTADPGWVTGLSHRVIAPLTCGVSMLVDREELDVERWYALLADDEVSVRPVRSAT